MALQRRPSGAGAKPPDAPVKFTPFLLRAPRSRSLLALSASVLIAGKNPRSASPLGIEPNRTRLAGLTIYPRRGLCALFEP